ncbi:MAG: hypothetical protein ACRDY7_17875, partial [Acidimicrobiia bacterium]
PLIKVMNLISLLILPAIIELEDSDGARLAVAIISTLVLVGAVLYSKRKTGSMMDAPAGAPAAAATAVAPGDPPMKLAADALDRWIMDLGDEDADLRTQLREAKTQLNT